MFRRSRLPRGKQAVAQVTAAAATTDSTLSQIEVLAGRIASVRTMISSGVESAAYGDKRTEFRSLEELREILNALEEELADLLGLGGRVRQVRMTTSWDKGL